VYPRGEEAILICDDDPDIRGVLRRTLREYRVVETASPREALDALRARPFAAIVSDFSLGTSSDGLDLLQMVRVQYPETVRFLVTGNRDVEVVVRAVNEGSVHRYFLKPWNDDQLRSALRILLHSRRGS
jgi:DNA-binding NtrC family response regulator